MNPNLDELKVQIKHCEILRDEEYFRGGVGWVALNSLISIAQSVIEGRLVPKGNTPAEGMIYGMDSKYSKPTLTEEELERILPKKKDEERGVGEESGMIYRNDKNIGYNQGVEDSKKLILKHLRGE